MIHCKLLVNNAPNESEWVKASLNVESINFIREATSTELTRDSFGKAVVMVAGTQYITDKDYEELDQQLKNAQMGMND